MTGYLYGLGLLGPEDLPLIAQARDKEGDVKLPSRDSEAYFKLFFRTREREKGESEP